MKVYLELSNRSAESIHLPESSSDRTTQNPGKILELLINNDWWWTHRRLCRCCDILEIPGVTLEGRIKTGVGHAPWFVEDKWFSLSTKYDRRGTIMVGTTIAKYQFIDTRWTCTKGELFLRTASMIGSTSGPWAWTQRFKVDSHFFNASPFIHFSFFWRNCSDEDLSGEAPEEYDS